MVKLMRPYARPRKRTKMSVLWYHPVHVFLFCNLLRKSKENFAADVVYDIGIFLQCVLDRVQSESKCHENRPPPSPPHPCTHTQNKRYHIWIIWHEFVKYYMIYSLEQIVLWPV